jgi:hypothetical protein
MTLIYPRLAFAVLFTVTFASAQRGGTIAQQLTFAPYHASGIYNVGETVGWTVTPGPAEPTYSYKWTIRRNNAAVLKEGKLDLSSGKDKIEITVGKPEMIYVAMQAAGAETTQRYLTGRSAVTSANRFRVLRASVTIFLEADERGRFRRRVGPPPSMPAWARERPVSN